MSWDCPHQTGKELHCEKLKKPCQPLQKGCVLAGKVKTGREDDSMKDNRKEKQKRDGST